MGSMCADWLCAYDLSWGELKELCKTWCSTRMVRCKGACMHCLPLFVNVIDMFACLDCFVKHGAEATHANAFNIVSL